MRASERLLIVACIALCGGVLHAQTFSARIDAVRVDALVTDRGRVLSNLGARDFEVRDNGVLQDIELVSHEELPVDVILSLDVSSSVSGERLTHLQTAGKALLAKLSDRDRAALVTFSNVVQLREAMTGDLDRIRSALEAVAPEGQTALVDGSYGALALAASDQGRSLLIVFSDGVDTASWLSPEAVLDAAGRGNAVVYAITVRGRVEPEFLRELSTSTGGSLLEVESTQDLSPTFVRILDEFRQRYLLSYTPHGVRAGGWHRLNVRVKGRRATVNARAGYQSAN